MENANDYEKFEHLYGKRVQMNDRFESTHVWDEALAVKNAGRWTPKEIHEEQRGKDSDEKPKIDMEITIGATVKTRLTLHVSGPIRLKVCQEDMPHLNAIKEYAEALAYSLRPITNTIRCTIVMEGDMPHVRPNSLSEKNPDVVKINTVNKQKPVYANEYKKERAIVHIIRNTYIAIGAFSVYTIIVAVVLGLKPENIKDMPTWADLTVWVLAALTLAALATRPPRKYPMPQEK